ncbi:pyridoxal phosphate-dependent aminotransferase family protein [Sulfurimonas sp. MAG313]|nr:pyridoxal phosphate-dependent aminotransferase family protein [Sulfurimonas sp. MAG313]MDF1881383.1 pyridoxal phosphate-dependent aminotransferase family protein [Sulfurimonas sp. MAG313]
MNYYEKELAALKRSGRYRQRRLFDENLIDLASNDYLGLSHKKELIDEAYKRVSSYQSHASKASMLVNGYHPIHASFEKALCEANGFEDGIVLGSGFSANVAMIETLLRKGDELFMDEKYHASGVMATKLNDAKTTYFKHNDANELETQLKASTAKRKVIAVEGIYSMDADVLNIDIIHLADKYDALLILDEAHSSGVIGNKLMGILDYYNLPVKDNYIKMGTLGKAYGSFGAYILASSHIIEYLINRAKPIIYATAPSLFDTALGHVSLEYILKNSESLKKEIKENQHIIKEVLGIEIKGLIVPMKIGNNKKVMQIQEKVMNENYLIGAIRQPTVDTAIIRLIARLGVDKKDLHTVCNLIQGFLR